MVGATTYTIEQLNRSVDECVLEKTVQNCPDITILSIFLIRIRLMAAKTVRVVKMVRVVKGQVCQDGQVGRGGLGE